MYTKEDLISRLKKVVQKHSPVRQERFLPFLIFLEKQTDCPRYSESIAIVQYFLDNAHLSMLDEWVYVVLKKSIDELNKNIDYHNFIGQTPIPLADYLKFVYDLRDN